MIRAGQLKTRVIITRKGERVSNGSGGSKAPGSAVVLRVRGGVSEFGLEQASRAQTVYPQATGTILIRKSTLVKVGMFASYSRLGQTYVAEILDIKPEGSDGLLLVCKGG